MDRIALKFLLILRDIVWPSLLSESQSHILIKLLSQKECTGSFQNMELLFLIIVIPCQ